MKLKKALTIFYISLSIVAFSQKKEMSEAFLKGDYDKTIRLGKKIIEAEPNDFETNLMVVKAYNQKADFGNAVIYLQKSQALTKQDWEKSWVLIESTITNFGLGNFDAARKDFIEAKQASGTKNAEQKLKEIGLLFGFDDWYSTWKTRESENIIFHFESTISNDEIERIVLTRQKSFNEINRFFNSDLPKKIDFFVWNQKENYNTHLNVSLGFSKPIFCISHSRMNQTPGHEIAHNISFWLNKDNVTTKFINEGIGVYFDGQKNDKLKIAKEAFRKNPIDIKVVWRNQPKTDDTTLYPISGAFVAYLIDYDKLKFLELVQNQTYENAEKIYLGEFDQLIEVFNEKLKE